MTKQVRDIEPQKYKNDPVYSMLTENARFILQDNNYVMYSLLLNGSPKC